MSSPPTPAVGSGEVPAATQSKKTPPSLHQPQLNFVTINIENPKNESKLFLVHKAIACHHSRMLDKAFNSPFIEGQTQAITIKDFYFPDAFGAVQSWMYMQTPKGLQEENWACSFTQRLCISWVFGDRLIMPKMQNEIMRALKAEGKNPIHLAGWLYKNTPPESKLRKWFVQHSAALMDKTFLKVVDLEHLPSELVVDMVMALKMIPGLASLNPTTPGLDDFLVRID